MFRQTSASRFDTAHNGASSSCSFLAILADVVVSMSVYFIVRLHVVVLIILLPLLVLMFSRLKTPHGN